MQEELEAGQVQAWEELVVALYWYWGVRDAPGSDVLLDIFVSVCWRGREGEEQVGFSDAVGQMMGLGPWLWLFRVLEVVSAWMVWGPTQQELFEQRELSEQKQGPWMCWPVGIGILAG